MQSSGNRVNTELGRAVAHARAEAELTQSQLAERLGEALGKTVNTPTINRLEKGTRPTPLHEVYALADVLGVTVEDLMPQPDVLQRLTGLLSAGARNGERQIKETEKELETLRKRHENVEWQLNSLRRLQDLKNGETIPHTDVAPVVNGAFLAAVLFGDIYNHEGFLDALGIPYGAAKDFIDLIGTEEDEVDILEHSEKLIDILMDLFIDANRGQITNGSAS